MRRLLCLLFYYTAEWLLYTSYRYQMYLRHQWETNAAALVWQSNPQHPLWTQGFPQLVVCRNTKIGPFRITDDRGYTCLVNQSFRGCCFPKPLYPQPFSCHDCSRIVDCCRSYESCVACCMGVTKKSLSRSSSNQRRDRNPRLDPFALCLSTCRTSSKHLLHENTYRSNWTSCFGTTSPTNNASPKFSFMNSKHRS